MKFGIFYELQLPRPHPSRPSDREAVANGTNETARLEG